MGLIVLLLTNTSQTYNPASEEVAVGTISRRPLASRCPSRFHNTARPSTGLGREKQCRIKKRETRIKRIGRKKRNGLTESNYNILNPSVYLSMRQKMNDDSLYIRAVSSAQHEGTFVSFFKCSEGKWLFMENGILWINNIKIPFFLMFVFV